MSFVCLLMHCYCFVARNNSPESEIWAAHFHCEMPLICGITGWDVYSSQKWLINKRTLSIALLWLVLKQNRKKKITAQMNSYQACQMCVHPNWRPYYWQLIIYFKVIHLILFQVSMRPNSFNILGTIISEAFNSCICSC